MATGRPLILVVDDDEAMRDAMAATLEAAGYEAISARTATQALALLRSGGVRPSLIFLDLVMPEMSGVEFRAAQLQDEALEAIPVVFVSAFPNTVDVLQSGGRLHAAGVLRKPVDAGKLLAVVRRLCPPPESSSA